MAFRRALAAAALLSIGMPAEAVLPPEQYRQARIDAAHHVQVAVTGMEPPETTPGVCRIRGWVVKVFRSRNGLLSPSVPVTFTVDCLNPGDMPGVGATLWEGVQSLKEAKFIEAYLNGSERQAMSVARWQYLIIPSPSAEQACPADKPGMTCW